MQHHWMIRSSRHIRRLLLLLMAMPLLVACVATPSTEQAVIPQSDESLITITEALSQVATSTPAISTSTATATLTPLPAATDTPTVAPTTTPLPPATTPPTATRLPVTTNAGNVTATPTTVPIADLLTVLPRPTPRNNISDTVRVPILMYHYLSTPPADADKYRLDLSVTPANFAQQMQYLADNGYTPLDLYDLALVITQKQDLPEKPVIITFDDGYRDNYENAFPILQQHGFKATFFVITGPIDQGAEQYMTWEMVEQMSQAGMRIESHTVTHPQLAGMERDDQYFQIQSSQQTIADHIGYTPRFLCYPGGFYDETTIDVLRELDMWGAVTTQGGQWHSFDGRYEWPRMRMRNATTLREFAGLLEQ
ncbi:MAG: polysaccharide deacetylase family protein [Anaerolineae bacterium]|nr:polysaccharide deacetylase family protein [Anaerolineae bacterium]